MKIIDCHVHPSPVADYDQAVRKLIQHMSAHHIERMIASDLGDKWPHFPSSDIIRAANERLRKASVNSGGKLEYLIYLNPQLADWRKEFMAHVHTACGVKLWVSLRSADGSLEASREVLRLAAEYRKPVLIHSLDRTGGLLPGEVGINDIIDLAVSVPECRIVAAHMCGNWRKTVAMAKDFPGNVFFDFSGFYPERTALNRFVEAFGCDRVMYGSDAPGRSFGSQLSKISELAIAPEDLQKILYDNAVKVFSLPEFNQPVPPRQLPEWPVKSFAEDNFCFVGSCRYFDHAVSVGDLQQAAARAGIKICFAASLEAACAVNQAAANQAYLQSAANCPLIRPLAAIDLVNKAAALQQLDFLDGFAGVWISPYLHNYQLDDPGNMEFFRSCARREIPLWINTSLGDDRFRPLELHSRLVRDEEITRFIRQFPANKYVFQGVADLATLSRDMPDYCYWECSKLSDGEYKAEQFFAENGGDPAQLCFGSEYPFRAIDSVANVLQGRI